MPIYYAALLNKRRHVVLHGAYDQSRTYFRKQVEENSKAIRPYGVNRIDCGDNIFIVYKNQDPVVSCALVLSHEVDL